MSKRSIRVGGEEYVPRATLDAMVRARIAEIMSAAGVDRSRISQEVLFMMPLQFTLAYEHLYDLATQGALGVVRDESEVGVAGDPKRSDMGGGANGRTRDTAGSREKLDRVVVRSGGSARRGARGAARGSTGATAGVGMAEAMELKTAVDKRLRGIARDVHALLSELGVSFDPRTGEMMVQVSGRGRRGEEEGGGKVVAAAMNDAIDAR